MLTNLRALRPHQRLASIFCFRLFDARKEKEKTSFKKHIQDTCICQCSLIQIDKARGVGVKVGFLDKKHRNGDRYLIKNVRSMHLARNANNQICHKVQHHSIIAIKRNLNYCGNLVEKVRLPWLNLVIIVVILLFSEMNQKCNPCLAGRKAVCRFIPLLLSLLLLLLLYHCVKCACLVGRLNARLTDMRCPLSLVTESSGRIHYIHA